MSVPDATNDAYALSAPTPAPACVLVIFGAHGDLTSRLLMPALYNLAGAKLLADNFSLLGVDRNAGTDADFRDHLKQAMESFTPEAGGEFAENELNNEWWSWLEERIHYVQGDFTESAVFDDLSARLAGANAIFYLAVADHFFGDIITRLHAATLTAPNKGAFRRVVIEKPFGHDLQSAEELNRLILTKLDEDQIYRIDHFLGKETVQNIMAMRFANILFDAVWDRDHIDNVQITAAETVGVEQRGKFYEATGALRDMVPSHMFQLLALTAMEPPHSFDADAIRSEKAKVIDAIRPLTPDEVKRNVVRGQYSSATIQGGDVRAYTSEPDVASESETETYVALRLTIDNPRWADVPFYLRTGKRLAGRTTEIAVQFKRAPTVLFQGSPFLELMPNIIVLHLQPHEGIALHFSAKRPGQTMRLGDVKMDFHYKDFFDLKPATGYETLIYDVLIGDPTLFNRADNIETGWKGVQPILDAVASGAVPIRTYRAGSKGPAEADAMLARDGRSWRELS